MADASLDFLRRHLVVRSAYDALVVVGSVGRSVPPGTNVIVFLDDQGRFVDHWSVLDSDEKLDDVVRRTCALAPPAATGAFLVSNRMGQEPADRPDDEQRWLQLGATAEDAGIDLLDWLVVWGRAAFSLAEHAEVPAGWPSTSEAIEAHPELRLDPLVRAPHRSARRRLRARRWQ